MSRYLFEDEVLYFLSSDDGKEETSNWISYDDGKENGEEISSCNSSSKEKMNDQPCSSAFQITSFSKPKRGKQHLLEKNAGRAAALTVIRQGLQNLIAQCNNNNLRNIYDTIPCQRSFSVLVIISGISPHTNRRLCISFSEQFYW